MSEEYNKKYLTCLFTKDDWEVWEAINQPKSKWEIAHIKSNQTRTKNLKINKRTGKYRWKEYRRNKKK